MKPHDKETQNTEELEDTRRSTERLSDEIMTLKNASVRFAGSEEEEEAEED